MYFYRGGHQGQYTGPVLREKLGALLDMVESCSLQSLLSPGLSGLFL